MARTGSRIFEWRRRRSPSPDYGLPRTMEEVVAIPVSKPDPDPDSDLVFVCIGDSFNTIENHGIGRSCGAVRVHCA